MNITKEVEIQGRGFQIAMCLAFFLSLLFFMLMPSPGIFCFLGICILNIITYFMRKQDIDLYLNSFRCVIQLLEAQKGLEKLKIPELEPYREESRKYRDCLRTFQKGSFLVLDQSSTGGGPGRAGHGLYPYADPYRSDQVFCYDESYAEVSEGDPGTDEDLRISGFYDLDCFFQRKSALLQPA